MEKMIPITFFKNIRNPKDFVPLVYEDILPGYYLINTLGEIYSLKRGKIMNQDTNKGYKRICLITSNGKRNFSVHRLVAYTFMDNPDYDYFTDVNHINGNKASNNIDNLEWCTNNQNKRHASETGLYQHGEDRYNSVYSDNLAREICEMFEKGIPYKEVYRYYMDMNPNSASTLGSFIYRLYHRLTRKYITKDYNYNI